jgi:hypothetical protein
VVLERLAVKPVIRSDCNSPGSLLPTTIRLTTGMKYCLKRNRPSDGSIVSAHADVSSNPRATNAAKHCWIQNEAKWFDRNEVQSRKPRRATDVDRPIQNVTVWAAHRAVQMKPWTVLLRASRSASPGNWYKTQKCPSRVPGVISESHRSRCDRRSKNESFGRIGSRSQPNTHPKR